MVVHVLCRAVAKLPVRAAAPRPNCAVCPQRKPVLLLGRNGENISERLAAFVDYRDRHVAVAVTRVGHKAGRVAPCPQSSVLFEREAVEEARRHSLCTGEASRSRRVLDLDGGRAVLPCAVAELAVRAAPGGENSAVFVDDEAVAIARCYGDG